MNGKKILGLLLAALMLTSAAWAAEDVTVEVDGRTVPAFVEDSVTYVQLTTLLEILGGWETQWDRRPDRLGGDRSVYAGCTHAEELRAG